MSKKGNEKKEREKSPTPFQFLKKFFITLIKSFFFVIILVAISGVTNSTAYEASRRERRRRASIGVAQIAQFPRRNRGVTLTLTRKRLNSKKIQGVATRNVVYWKKSQSITARRGIPARDGLYWEEFQAIPESNRLDWGELQRLQPPNPYNPNPTPIARPLTLPRVPPIDRSPGHEEQWTGNLSWHNLQCQFWQTFLLQDQGEELRCQVSGFDAAHPLLTAETYETLSAVKIRCSIKADERLLSKMEHGLAPPQPRGSGTTLDRYREWRACADIFSEAIEELW
jgi:hypothetical protein